MIEKADIQIATCNWKNWASVFEHRGEVFNNPLLANQEVFNRFAKEYGVARTIRKGCRDSLRNTLRSNEILLSEKLRDVTGRGIDELDENLRAEYGTCNGRRGLRSMLSKVAAFLAPSSFIAWDKYARVGLNIELNRTRSYVPSSYAEYLSDLNGLLNGEGGRLLAIELKDKYPTDYSSQDERFKRRVLDVYLMRVGGRRYRSKR